MFQCSNPRNGTVTPTSVCCIEVGLCSHMSEILDSVSPKIQHSARSFVLAVSWMLPRPLGVKKGMGNLRLGPAAWGWCYTEETIAQPHSAKCRSSEMPSWKHHTLKRYEELKGPNGWTHGYKVLEDRNSSPKTHMLKSQVRRCVIVLQCREQRDGMG